MYILHSIHQIFPDCCTTRGLIANLVKVKPYEIAILTYFGLFLAFSRLRMVAILYSSKISNDGLRLIQIIEHQHLFVVL